MSDEQIPDTDQLDTARAEIAAGVAQYADGWPSTEGGIVTAFVCIAEIVRVDGGRSLLEIYCDGDGSPAWRNWNHQGMLFSALYDPAEGA